MVLTEKGLLLMIEIIINKNYKNNGYVLNFLDPLDPKFIDEICKYCEPHLNRTHPDMIKPMHTGLELYIIGCLLHTYLDERNLGYRICFGEEFPSYLSNTEYISKKELPNDGQREKSRRS